MPHPRAFHTRRRKRDLVRTLSYLFALRILAFHRKVKYRLSIAWRIVWSFLLRWGAVSKGWVQRRSQNEQQDEDEDDGFSPKRRKRKGVHWAPEAEQSQQIVSLISLLNPYNVIRGMPKWAIWLAALLFFRSRFFRIRARAVVTLVKKHAAQRTARWQQHTKRLGAG